MERREEWQRKGKGEEEATGNGYTSRSSCLHFVCNHHTFPRHRWSSGRILACHAGDPGSIPGRCTVFFCCCLSLFLTQIYFCQTEYILRNCMESTKDGFSSADPCHKPVLAAHAFRVGSVEVLNATCTGRTTEF